MSTVTPDAAARRDASSTSPSDTSIIAVAPASAATTPSRTGGSGRSCAARAAASSSSSAPKSIGSGVTVGVPESPEQDAEASAGEAECPGHRHDVSDACAAAQQGHATVERAERGDRDRERVRDGEVAALDGATRGERIACGAQAVGDLLDEGRARVVGHRQRDQQGGRPGTHRRDVGEVHRRRLPAEVESARPCEAEVRAVHQRVGGRDHAPIRGGEHGRVVARPDHRGRASEPREDPAQDLTLRQLPHGRVVGGRGHPSTLASCSRRRG